MWDLIISVPDHCLSFYFVKLDPYLLASSSLLRHSLPCHRHKEAYLANLSAPLVRLTTFQG